MIEFEGWKNEIIDSIKELHDETKKIVKYLEAPQDEQDVQDDQQEQDVQEEQEEQDEQEAQDVQEVKDVQEVIIQKLDDINDSINNLTTIVVESSIVVSISIIIALAFHYFINQISKW